MLSKDSMTMRMWVLFVLLLVLVHAQSDVYDIVQSTNIIIAKGVRSKLRPENILRGLGPYGYRGDLQKVYKALIRAKSERILNIAVIGDSVPFGSMVGPDKSWVSTLEPILSQILHPMKITVNNLAIPGVASHVQAISRIPSMLPILSKAHLILVDICMNDSPGICLSDCTTTDTSITLAPNQTLPEEGKTLMKMLLQAAPLAGLIYFETVTRGYFHPPHATTLSDLLQARKMSRSLTITQKPDTTCNLHIASLFHWRSLVELKIPLISYRDASCPPHHTPLPQQRPHPDQHPLLPPTQEMPWGPYVHPNVMPHRFMGRVVVLSLHELFRASDDTAYRDLAFYSTPAEKEWRMYTEPSSTNTNKLQTSFQGNEEESDPLVQCGLNPVYAVSTLNRTHFQPTRVGSAWSYIEDVQNKWGWVSQVSEKNAEADKEIVFDISVSSTWNIFYISHLKSYDSAMGQMQCCVECEHAFKVLFSIDGKWASHTSQEQVSHFSLPRPALRASSDHQQHQPSGIIRQRLRCRVNSGKFKIVSIIGC
jgi:hypothetical protein